MRVETRGEFGGLGLEVTQEEGFVKVVSPIDGTPAAAAGMESGDFITAVDGENLLGLTLDEALQLLRGPVGSEVIITVVREGEIVPLELTYGAPPEDEEDSTDELGYPNSGPFSIGLGGQRANITKTKRRRAIGHDTYQVAFVRKTKDIGRVFGDLQTRLGHPRRVRHGQITLR